MFRKRGKTPAEQLQESVARQTVESINYALLGVADAFDAIPDYEFTGAQVAKTLYEFTATMDSRLREGFGLGPREPEEPNRPE